MATFFYALYAIAHLILLIWGFGVWSRTRRVGTALIIVVTAGTLYDNLILAFGRTIGVGPLLAALSWWRFAAHQFLLPLLVVSVDEQMRISARAKGDQERSPAVAWALAIIIIALGYTTRMLGLQLVPEELNGVVRYLAVGTSGPPLVSLLTIAFIVFGGFVLWRRSAWPWLFWVAILVFIGEGVIRAPAFRLVVGSGVEVLFIWTLLATDIYLLKAGSAGKGNG